MVLGAMWHRLPQAEDWLSRLVELVWLGAAQRRAEGYSLEQQRLVAELVAAAIARERVALTLREPASAAAALGVHRDAVLLAARAVLIAAGRPVSDEAAGALQLVTQLEEVLAERGAGDLEAALQRLRPVLEATDPLVFDRMTPEEQREKRLALEMLLSWLRAEVEPRPVDALRMQRWTRVGLVALSAIALLILSFTRAAAPANVALGRPARASSRHPGTPDAAGVVDGEFRAGFGVHTRREQAPWVEVDLETIHAVERVVVYHRADGYQDESLPLSLQVSEDGQTWQDVSLRSDRFTHASPWETALGGRRARLVRVTKPSPGYIALGEIVVYGRSVSP